ncbi:MAG TPA: glycosyltransferase family 4 protein [Verrucomicrobiae bacterium]|nr:glycosyltransferase family 4 protein [Verrucomicrobiae bacterium]
MDAKAKSYTNGWEKARRGFPGLAGLLKRFAPKKTLRITGPYRGVTGYDHMVRSIVRALAANGVQIELRDLPGWSQTRLPAAATNFFNRFRRRRNARVHLHFCMPPQVEPSAGCVNVNYTMFEATRLCPQWVDASLKNDLTIVPTESSRRCWIDSGIGKEKVKLCPLGVDFDSFAPGAPPLPATTSDGRPAGEFRLRFLNVAESIYRKNLAGLLRAWISATDSRDDAVLILKTGFYAPGRREKFEGQMREVEKSLGKPLADSAPIIVLDSFLAPEEMPRLYAMATHYWSMSRGEGFDLPMLEAGACELQLIAPDHSAYREYLNPPIAHLLPAREVAAQIPDDAPLSAIFAGASWWEPEETAAVELIRGLVNGAIPPARSARAELLEKYTWDKTARRLWEIIEPL